MMKDKAMSYYRQGYNCSQCILKAYESEYRTVLNKQCFAMCQAVNTGFGIGSICSVLVAGIMLFGMLFNEATAKRLRIKLLDEFGSRYGNMNCGALRNNRKNCGCDELVGEIAGITQALIEEER